MPSEGRLYRLAGAARRLHDAVLGPRGTETSVEMRTEAYGGQPEPPDVARYVAKVRDHAHRVVEADIAALRDLGLSDDAIFELTMAAALGAAHRRLVAGLALLEGGS